ncbi:hypothetical protein [Halorarius litoreus]|uniref:hypothetical protein n=1 Tax=Halorarius litoreus TaxID=2962676 RepID=UPI0020CC2ACB|nr:hypothetical protein [Halorarius litoreus]
MRQLSGCDFCGGTASGTFEVLPAEYDPEGKGKRMLLCDHCRDALSSILDPLLDAKAEAGGRNLGGDVEPDISPVSDEREDTADESDDSIDADAESSGAPGDHLEANGGTESESADQPAADDESTGSQMAATGAGASSRVPKGYRKVLRFLENREMPMDRQEAIEMTAGAYGMDESAVDAAIDHAVSHGRLKSYDGEIRRA